MVRKAAAGLTKEALRRTLLGRLRSLREEERRHYSQVIWRKVTRLAAFRRATVVCCYVSLPYEVQTWQMIEKMIASGKRVVVPASVRKTRDLELFEIRDPVLELAPGAHGVMEPVQPARRPVPVRDLDLVLVPGVAFDARGHRLGHGQGYYDRFLARVPETVPAIGLAFDFQVLSELPLNPHDRPVHRVVTN